MTYYFAKALDMDFQAAITATTRALNQHGFGVLTEIDVKDTLHKKLGAEFRPSRILGACNPATGLKALGADDKIGTMLPCNVIVQELANGRIEMAAVDPVASMQAVGDPALTPIAETVRANLRNAIETLGD